MNKVAKFVEDVSESAVMFADKAVAQQDRKDFVHNLGVLLAQTRMGIAGCLLDDDDQVHIYFRNPAGEIIHEEVVNVLFDSYMAIVRDVAKNVR